MYNMDNLIISFTDEFRVLLLYPQDGLCSSTQLGLTGLPKLSEEYWILEDVQYLIFYYTLRIHCSSRVKNCNQTLNYSIFNTFINVHIHTSLGWDGLVLNGID